MRDVPGGGGARGQIAELVIVAGDERLAGVIGDAGEVPLGVIRKARDVAACIADPGGQAAGVVAGGGRARGTAGGSDLAVAVVGVGGHVAAGVGGGELVAGGGVVGGAGGEVVGLRARGILQPNDDRLGKLPVLAVVGSLGDPAHRILFADDVPPGVGYELRGVAQLVGDPLGAGRGVVGVLDRLPIGVRHLLEPAVVVELAARGGATERILNPLQVVLAVAGRAGSEIEEGGRPSARSPAHHCWCRPRPGRVLNSRRAPHPPFRPLFQPD